MTRGAVLREIVPSVVLCKRESYADMDMGNMQHNGLREDVELFEVYVMVNSIPIDRCGEQKKEIGHVADI